MRSFHEDMFTQKLNDFGTALVDGKFPVSGAFIDAAQFDYFGFLVELGTLNSVLTFAAQAATAINGALVTVTGKSQAILATDDNNWLFIGLRAEELDDRHFVSLDVSGAAGGDDFACMTFLGWGARQAPVTQPAGFVYNIDPLTGV